MKEFTGTKLNEVFSGETAVVVQFYAEWCGPCQMLKPILEKISNEMHDVIFYRVDIDQYRDIAVESGVKSIPTLILYKNGEEVTRDAGFKPKHLVENWINANK